MANSNVKKMLGQAFMQVADAIETGHFQSKIKIGDTTLGSEHGIENILQGAEMAQANYGVDVVLIGPKCDSKLEQAVVNDEKEMYAKMEELLDSGTIAGCVTLHYNFPIGVSTVGKVVTPVRGKEMLIATTTGTSATNRVEAMIRNAINGNAVAKALGAKAPTLGILNVDGANAVERALTTLIDNGYPIAFSSSVRADGGAIMRGNDLLNGSVDVMVNDTLTGNILMKMFSSYTTGGSYEASGYGYGPGIGDGYNRLVLIISRASGSPVIANALQYAKKLAEGNIIQVARDEYALAKKAKLDDILAGLNKGAVVADVKAPDKEVVTYEIKGVDIMELENAVSSLWSHGIYAESGMGCTGPIVLVNDKNKTSAEDALVKDGFIKI